LAPARFSTTTGALQPLADAGRHDARQQIVGSAGRKTDDEAQRPVGKIRLLRAGACERQDGKSGENRTSAKHEHRRSC
jgi:hypothetical protein